ncbi:acetyl-CoA carboxylase biotin carboxyl carrier protein [Catenulispora sp. GP43]|uniref:acetyl-CoA carboxylase biotin carboxyl carrier protein n=1 Tax=Catenulispora sp. GP43 TaxID=3156263 RepID=UPI003513D9AD
MTTDVRGEFAKDGGVRRHATGVMRPAVVTAAGLEADLEAMCHHVAELARTRPEAPSRIRVEHLGTALEIEWPSAVEKAAAAMAAGAGPGSGYLWTGAGPGSGMTAGAASAAGAVVPHMDPPAVDDGLHRVCAPMIGTFYHSPEPGTPPFVSVGDTVVPGQQIGILEVMKMMSPVEASAAGTVREILVPDGSSVEFQQPLMSLEPVGGR